VVSPTGFEPVLLP